VVRMSDLRLTVVGSNAGHSWGKGGKVTSAGWQVTLCDPMVYGQLIAWTHKRADT